MKTHALQQLCQKAFDELVEAVEKGESAQLKAYLRVMGKFSRYSLRNITLIHLQKPQARQVAGFWTWKHLGRSVKKGAKGIAILAPLIYREKRLQKKAEDDAQDMEVDVVTNFKTAYVFDVSDTQGQDLPTFSQVKGDPGVYLDRLQSFMQARGIKLETRHLYGTTQGYSAGGLIVLQSGLSAAERMSTLVHELAHELMHRQASQRDRTVQELEAEAISYVVCSAIHLELHTAHADYLQLYQGDKAKLVSSLSRIQRTASEILQAITQTEANEMRAVA